MQIDNEGAFEVAKRSRGTPRIANRLLRRVRDYAEVKADGQVSKDIADAALLMLDVDHAGLDVMDRKLLSAILHKFGGGPVGLDNVGAAIGESTDTIEDVLEPYLIQQGLLQRTPRGRMATWSTYQHFGLNAPEALRTPICGATRRDKRWRNPPRCPATARLRSPCRSRPTTSSNSPTTRPDAGRAAPANAVADAYHQTGGGAGIAAHFTVQDSVVAGPAPAK